MEIRCFQKYVHANIKNLLAVAKAIAAEGQENFVAGFVCRIELVAFSNRKNEVLHLKPSL
jgi:hypothetical protein